MKKTYLYFVIVLLFIPCMAQDLPLARYNDLRFRNGLAYKDGQLFTGILLDTLLINNRPVTIGQFKEGKKNSLFVERYGPNKKKYEGSFVEGKKEGTHFEWYENGNMKSEANYSRDNKHGKESRWSEDGKKQLEVTYVSGMMDGIVTEWYENGNVKSETSYSKDKKHGKETCWNEDGKKKLEATYLNGIMDGVMIEWYPNGIEKSETQYVAGKKSGKESIWYDNGLIQQEVIYQQNKKHGISKEWYSNGALKDSIYYSENIIADGAYNLYKENGEIERERSYTNGSLIKEKIFISRIMKDGDCYDTVQEIYKNGEKANGVLKNDKKDGVWTMKSNTGRIISEEEYIDGTLFIVKDIDGNSYTTVQIGSQCWMKENLKVTKSNNGFNIALLQKKSLLKMPGYSWHNDDIDYKDPYGALYNWYAVETGLLCPKGWHVPSQDDWAQLISYLGGWYVAGGKMKETGTSHWDRPNIRATNESGFTGLPGGFRGSDGNYYRGDEWGLWWSSTGDATGEIWYRCLDYKTSDITKGTCTKEYAMSVRCVKD
ncbi:MAG: FISUMP domain-containing protein [Bacilli bacterium]|nr:FISUMP domain-containing protein [Bacteroidales bacterium]